MTSAGRVSTVDPTHDETVGTAAIRMSGVRKHYGDTAAVAGVDLEIAEGEFFTMLGPSGSGKTTLLRLIAGFEQADAGTVELRGVDVSRTPPYLREVNTVFQDYALFPHMTVQENVEYGMRVAKVARAERRERAGKALEMVQLTGLGGRNPGQLSGGQRQRVALARAIVNEPVVLLLDEPLGALDLKLRQEMQIELKRIHQELGMTFVYVTHDQEEALTMSDRIAVMRDGQIEQIADPVEVYERPATEFVAGFIGVSNLLDRGGRRITVRPEKIHMLMAEDAVPAGATVEPGKIEEVIYLGTVTRFIVGLDSGERLVVVRQNLEGDAAMAGALQGTSVRLAWRAEDTHELKANEDVEDKKEQS